MSRLLDSSIERTSETAQCSNTERSLTHLLSKQKGASVNATHEAWRPIVGYEGFYEVSDLGRVRSVQRTISVISCKGNVGLRPIRSRILKPCTYDVAGHLQVVLSRAGIATSQKVHRLVLEAFVGPCPNGMEACHHDDNPANNMVANLRWDTRSANISDRYRNGWIAPGTAMTMCKKGLHKLEADNLLGGSRQRLCRQCRQEYERNYRRQKSAQRA